MTKEEVRKLNDEEVMKKALSIDDPDMLICSAELARRNGVPDDKIIWTVEDVDKLFTK